MRVEMDKTLDGMQQLLNISIIDKLCEYYWVRKVNKFNIQEWQKYKIREEHIDKLIREFQYNWITVNKDLFNLNKKDDTNTDRGTNDLNTSSNQTVDTEWKLEDNKTTSWKWNIQSWAKNIK
jgi:hypothetical protein